MLLGGLVMKSVSGVSSVHLGGFEPWSKLLQI